MKYAGRLLAAGVVALAATATGHAEDTIRYATDGYGMGALAIIAADKGFLKC